MISVTVIGDKVTSQRLMRGSLSVGGENLERALAFGGLLGINVAKRIAPLKTGNLRRSLHIGGHAGMSGGLSDTTGTDVGGNMHTPTSATLLCGTNVSYAKALEEGADPHDIRPKNKQALYWKGLAHPVMVVHHPGMAARPYLRPAFDETAPAIIREVGVSMMAILRAAVR